MKGRIWFSAVMALVGASLLVAASASGGTTGSAAASQSAAQKGGTYRILNTSDFDHLDPALAYFTHSWNWMGATQLRMYWYPYVAGAASERVAPMAAQGLPRISNNGKRYTITIKQGFKFSNGQPVTAASFKRAFDRANNAEAAVAGVVVPRRRGELVGAERADAGHQPEEGCARLHPAHLDAVLLGRADELPARRRGRQGLRLGRAVRGAGVEQEDVRSRRAEPAVEEQPGAVEVARPPEQRRPDHVRRHRWRPRDASSPVREQRGRRVRLPDRPGQGARRQVRRQQGPLHGRQGPSRSGAST